MNRREDAKCGGLYKPIPAEWSAVECSRTPSIVVAGLSSWQSMGSFVFRASSRPFPAEYSASPHPKLKLTKRHSRHEMFLRSIPMSSNAQLSQYNTSITHIM